MKVHVRLYAGLQRHTPEDKEPGNFFQVEFDGETVLDLLTRLSLRPAQVQIVMVNGENVLDHDLVLKDEDIVVMFPPIGAD
ncbi:MAG: MoaD/ThiS family protein [Candidatus Thorarchaeota archaeon]